MSVLTLQRLSKNYGPVQALREVSFEVPEGSIFGLLGPNGSGKTSLLGVVLGILQASGGEYRWSPGRVRGCLLETPNFYPYLTATENLGIVAALRGRGKEDIPSILARVGLDGFPTMPFQKFSLGMKQRLAIGATLLGDPQVVVLDEPTNGLDPAGIADVRDLIRGLAGPKRSVLLASHMLAEVEKVCSHVAILKKGQLLASGPLSEVLRDEDQLELKSDDLAALQAILEKHPSGPKVELRENTLWLSCPAGKLSPAQLNRYCMDKGQTLSHLVLRKQTLESRFLELTD